MPYKGTPPKDDEARQRRNPPIFDKTQVFWDGVRRGPDLPNDKVYRWSMRTTEWWNKWRDSPQAMVMHESDWESMLETALLHNRFWHPDCSDTARNALAAEIRRRVAAFGATFEDRLKLRMQIQNNLTEEEMEAQIAKDAAQIVNYADRLNKAVAEEPKPEVG